VTTPTTIYKKQKLDRDDIVDITDLDVVAWLKMEMRMMLDEELARAILVSDNRDVADADKISETNIRSIWKDDDMYAHHMFADAADTADDLIDLIARGRSNYKGSGNPTLFTTSVVLSDMLLLKDTTGRRIYGTQGELEAALRVASIVEVPVMENLTRTVTTPTAGTVSLKGIIVNLSDYAVGADKGGQVSMFDDFDIDYNQYKYLMETRCCGALTLPKSALVIEQYNA
jgi:HK97 family phage major capsid protein